MQSSIEPKRDRFPILAWGVLLFTILVVISGDIVQATESGAGCGETWPRCDGSLIPAISDLQTGVEFTHRMVTAVLGVGYIALVVGAWRRRGWAEPQDAARSGLRTAVRMLRPSVFVAAYRRSAPVWKAAVWSLVFFVVEVIIGAMLVVFGWVEHDASVGRVLADGVHLVNTFAMVGALTLVAFYARNEGRSKLSMKRISHRLIVTGAVVITVIGISGAINSLADTLFFSEEVVVDETPIASILVSIRGIHPVLAIGGGIAVFFIVGYLAQGRSDGVRRLARWIQSIVWVQFLVGFLNIVLETPLETQVIHLVTAQAVWVLFVLLSARLLSESARLDVAEAVPS